MPAVVGADLVSRLQRGIEDGALVQTIETARRELPHCSGQMRGQVLMLLSRACWSSGQYLDAMRAAVAASETFGASGSRAGVCEALCQIGATLRAAGDTASALTTLEQAETLARELADPVRLAEVLRTLGVCCSLMGRHQQALSCLGEACELLELHGTVAARLGARQSLLNARNRRSAVLPIGSPQSLAELRPALREWQALAHDMAAAGLARLEVMALGNHAITLHQCGDDAAAINELQPLLERYRAFGMQPNVGITYLELARCHFALNQHTTARDHLRLAIEILAEAGTLIDLQEANEELSRAEEALGNHRAALEALKRVRELDRRKSDEAAQAALAQRELRLELARLTSQWAREATEDPLTGLANRRALDRWMASSLARVERGEAVLSLLLLDLDHFKRINDAFGHAVGDAVLSRVASLIQNNCRSCDLAVRYGGEEFVLALFDVQPGAAAEIAQRLRDSVAAQPWHTVAAGLQVSVSIGVAAAIESADGASGLLTLADRRLYAAKHGGRNQVVAIG